MVECENKQWVFYRLSLRAQGLQLRCSASPPKMVTI